jgi:dUTP pyrophosphatase
MYWKYRILRPSAKPPLRAHPSDAGADIFYCPANPSNPVPIVLRPGEQVSIPTGIAVEVPHGYELKISEKSGLAQRGLAIRGGVIDSGYSGELVVVMANTDMGWLFDSMRTMLLAVGGDEARKSEYENLARAIAEHTIFIAPGMKIAQIVAHKIEHPIFMGAENIYESPLTISDRGTGGFGSTGK